MRVGFFGSGSFGLPTLEALTQVHDIAFVVSQPDRPAGRKRLLRATPISEFALSHGLDLMRPAQLGDETIDRLRQTSTDAFIVIAYGHKLSPPLIDDRFSCNLHGSLLPRWRGAAPIQRCLMGGDTVAGVSVITLADVMDAGEVLHQSATDIDPLETAGELHDRLAALGPIAIERTLQAHAQGTLRGQQQDQARVTQARKLSRAEATVDFDQPAKCVRGIIHGLTPWPGCDVRLNGNLLRIKRVGTHADLHTGQPPGTLLEDGLVACGSGAVELLQVQSAGSRPMGWDHWCAGHEVSPDARLQPT